MISAATIRDQYEALRAWAVGTVATHPPGLGILLRRGIPAWMETLCLAPSSPPAPSVPRISSPIVATPELAQVIASMLWEVQR
jgi:hypothetical protein